MDKLEYDEIKSIIDYRLEGKTINEIVKNTKHSKGTVSFYLNQYNIGGIVNNLVKLCNDINKKIIIQVLFNFFNPLLKRNLDIDDEIKLKIEKAIIDYQEKMRHYKVLTEEDKKYLQEQYNKIGNIRKLAKNVGISYEKLHSFISLNKETTTKVPYDAVKKRRFKTKQELLKYKGNKCEICGYDRCESALDFHHIDPSNKSFTISKNYWKNIEELKKEADKCILVCANHHREIHEGIIDLEKWAVSPHPDKVSKV